MDTEPKEVDDTENGAENYLLTEGVTSVVSRREYGKDRRSGVGHVSLFDWDDHVSPDEAIRYGSDGGLEGPTFLFESSDGNLHGWNVKVRNFARTSAVLDKFNDDTKHRKVGNDRGWWRLRVGEKRRVDDDVYKPAPEYIGTVIGGGHGYESRVSDPHLELARVAGVPKNEIERIRSMYRPVGDEMEIVAYVTMTDVEKKIRRRVFDE